MTQLPLFPVLPAPVRVFRRLSTLRAWSRRLRARIEVERARQPYRWQAGWDVRVRMSGRQILAARGGE